MANLLKLSSNKQTFGKLFGSLNFLFLTNKQGNKLNSTKSKTINERKERNHTFDVER
jgi:hypothetical protein